VPDEPIDGKPPAESPPSVPDLDFQVKYQRAFEAVLWSKPAVSVYGAHRAVAGIGADANTIIAWSTTSSPWRAPITATR
jgi:hypothetical protein